MNFLSLPYRLSDKVKTLLSLAVDLPDAFFGQSLELIFFKVWKKVTVGFVLSAREWEYWSGFI